MPDFYGKGVAIGDVGGFGSEGGNELLKRNSWPKLSSELDAVYAMLTERGVTSIGIVGFCWGAYAVVKAAATGKVAAGCSFHPSTSVAHRFYDEEEVAIASAVKAPIMFNTAGNDPDNLREGGAVVEAVRSAAGQDCVTVDFPDMKHGWVSRGDASDAAIARDVEKALKGGFAFFANHL